MKLDTNIYLPCEQFLGEASPDPAFNEPEVEAEDQETENERTAVDDGSDSEDYMPGTLPPHLSRKQMILMKSRSSVQVIHKRKADLKDEKT